MEKFEIKIGGKKIEFEIKNWTERTNGEAMVRCGDTQVLATAASSEESSQSLGFFPLTVNYEERYYARGKILGSRFLRREGKPSDNATLISRLIDRAIRPVFPDGFCQPTQVIITCLAWDEENDPDVLDLLAASLALSLSDIPWQGPIGAVRVGIENEKLILNPSYEQRETASLDVFFAGRKNQDEILINMIEANGEEVSEELILEAAKMALPEIKKLIEFQEKIAQKLAKEKFSFQKINYPEIEKAAQDFLTDKLDRLLYQEKQKTIAEGIERAKELSRLKQEFIKTTEEDYPAKNQFAEEVFEKEVKRTVQKKILEQEKRPDARKMDEIRKLHSEAAVIPRTHGSGLFSRGATRSLSILTLGGPGEQQLIEGMEIAGKKRFLHHYNFPPYSTGEVQFLRAPSRREIGHGMLAEKALRPLIPDVNDFPYTIRIVSEMLSSNGSTSMASICSSSLALMDAGVPIGRPVAGIAIGLVSKNLGEYKLLTDIQGPEDYHGNMDFKVAGTSKGITAIQMDVKIPGINQKILAEALERAKKARLKILDSMEKTIAKPRAKLSPFAPKISTLQISPDKIGEVIGSKGATIKRIMEETETEIDIEDSGLVYITSSHEEGIKKATDLIKDIAREMKVGEVFTGVVKRIMDFGVMLEICPGQKGLLRNSYLGGKIKMGDKIAVKIASIDEMGRLNLIPQKSYQDPQRKYGPRENRNRNR